MMGTQAVSPYQQVIEKTKNLAFRSQVLALTIEKKTGGHNKQDVSGSFYGSDTGGNHVSLTGAATSISFVATKHLLS